MHAREYSPGLGVISPEQFLREHFFALYMLDNRLGVWEFFQLIGRTEWNEEWTLQEWTSRYTAFLS
jgi:hypothetical protein